VIVIGVLAPDAPSIDAVVEVARRAAATGARTEVVGVAPAGSIGDRQLLTLATAGVGHATVTRSAAPGIDPADLELALRYLPDIRAIVLVRPDAAMFATAAAASGWTGATLVVIDPPGSGGGLASPGSPEPILLQAPARDPDGAFAGVIAALAARLDAGEDPASAWQSTVAALAIDPA
jgi:hypothetical protein